MGDRDAMNFKHIKQYIIQILDNWQRSLSDDQYGHLSREELIEALVKSQTRHERVTESLNIEILHLLDAIESMTRGDLTRRTKITEQNLLDFAITGAIHDSLNIFLDDLCVLLAQLPEASPLRQKYQIFQNDHTDFLSSEASLEAQRPETELERLMQKLLRTLDDAESITQGALFKRIQDYSDEADDYGSLYNDFYALVDCFNLIVEDLNQAIQDLPIQHPLRQKYQLIQSNSLELE